MAVRTREAEAPARGRPRRASASTDILDAALELLAERGFQAATIEAIAARAGVGRNTIYRRWSSKDELIADALEKLVVHIDLHDGDDVHALLLEWIRDFVRVFGDPLYGRILPAVLGELQANPAFARMYAERVVRPRYEALVGVLRRAVEAGALRRDADVEQIADLLAAPPFVRVLRVGLPPIGERYAEDLLETIWRGIAPEP
ncbi:MAG TPA: TetR/AcrR family transcriptional regulator [Gaiella sp.]|jgi:AcrR family transcriptional regulator